jgi:hypothetical protein
MVYILPAIAIAVIMWDKYIYFTCVTNAAYAAIMGILSVIYVTVSMGELINKGEI